METKSPFGYWIRRQRKALDLTQQDLADRVGCSLTAIKKIEADERRPSR
jgi:transcriptional regulator with XRE-family HTH domain